MIFKRFSRYVTDKTGSSMLLLIQNITIIKYAITGNQQQGHKLQLASDNRSDRVQGPLALRRWSIKRECHHTTNQAKQIKGFNITAR